MMTGKKNISPPRLAKSVLRFLLTKQNKQSVIGDFEEIYSQVYSTRGKLNAFVWYWVQAAKSIPSFITNSFEWGISMFKNYFRITIRNILKHRLFSFINISGLAVGLACCLFIFLYVQNEVSYDTYHANYENIYRVPMVKKTQSRIARWGVTSYYTGPSMKENLPEVIEAGRITEVYNSQVKYKTKMFYEDVKYADTELVNILKVNIMRGSLEKCLDRPATVLLTEEIANKYFGNEDPIGKIIKIDTLNCEVTAVIEDLPENTHMKFKVLLSLITFENIWWARDWMTGTCFTYLTLQPGTDINSFEEKIRNYAHNYADTFYQEGVEIINFLQPIADIHLYSHLDFEAEIPGNPIYVYIFIAVGLLVMIIACMNFINLSTARSANRAGEVGIRKVVGAHKGQLINQFISESVIMSVVAGLFALLIVALLMPSFNDLTGFNFSFINLFTFTNLAGYLILSILIGIAAGVYPAFFLSAFKPALVLKGSVSSGAKGSLFRRVLVVTQFSISILLIIGTLVVFDQIEYMQDQDLGFDKEQKLVLTFPLTGYLQDNYEFVKNEFLRSTDITNAAASSYVPGREYNTGRIFLTGKEAETGISIQYVHTDYDFISTYNLEMLEGRSFMREMGTDTVAANILMNEAAVKAFGFTKYEDAIHQEFFARARPLIGVVKDFHMHGLQNEIQPMFMMIGPWSFRYVTLNVNTENLTSVMSFVENKWSELFPGDPIEYFFLDTDFNNQYIREVQVGKLFRTFTMLGLFIACLGLFGLSAFVVSQRKKEIGIRKVLGASVTGIVGIITREFIILISIANVVAWPIAYLIMEQWLKNFAYRTSVGILIFIIAAAVAFSIALVTVGTHALKAANANPVDSLKYE
ncbi:ABC transporter permease [Bacteroidota bacterium]